MNRQQTDIVAFQDAVAKADWPKALHTIDRLIADRADAASLHYNRGLVLKNLDRRGDALAAFEKTLHLDPKHANARFEQGAALFNLGRFDEAADALRGYLESTPDDADALLNLGQALLRLGRPEEARESLQHAHRLAGSDETALALAAAARDCGDLAAMEQLVAGLRSADPALAAAILNVRTKGSRGRLPLRVARV